MAGFVEKVNIGVAVGGKKYFFQNVPEFLF
jgi:hypothetical protein